MLILRAQRIKISSEATYIYMRAKRVTYTSEASYEGSELRAIFELRTAESESERNLTNYFIIFLLLLY